MAYEKTTWMTGDTITAEKMNKIEDELAVLAAAEPEAVDNLARTGYQITRNLHNGITTILPMKDSQIQMDLQQPSNSTIASDEYNKTVQIVQGNLAALIGITTDSITFAADEQEKILKIDGGAIPVGGHIISITYDEKRVNGSQLQYKWQFKAITAPGEMISYPEQASAVRTLPQNYEGTTTQQLDYTSDWRRLLTGIKITRTASQQTIDNGDGTSSIQFVYPEMTIQSPKIYISDENDAEYSSKLGTGNIFQTFTWNGNNTQKNSNQIETDDLTYWIVMQPDSDGLYPQGTITFLHNTNEQFSDTLNKINNIETTLSETAGKVSLQSNMVSKKYLLGTTTAPTTSAKNITTLADTNVYLDSKGLTLNGALSSGRQSNTTIGNKSFAFGNNVKADGAYSSAKGEGTQATHRSQQVFGEYNIADPSSNTNNNRGTYVEIVGNGTSSTNSNARTLDWDGNEWLAGNLTLSQKLTFNNQETPYIHLETPGVAQLGICTDSIFLTRATPIESTDDGEEEIPVVNVDDPTNYGSFNFTFDDLAKLRILCDHYDQIMQLVNPPETNVEVTEPDNP